MEKYSSYKDSGEKWLGDIPRHWEIRKAKYLWNESDQRSEYGSEQLLSVSQYDGVRESTEESRSESLKGYKMVAENDLVINIMLAWLGGLGVSSYNGLVSPAYCVYKMIDEQDPRFLHYLYRTPLYLAEFARRSSGIVPSRWRMYTDDFGQVLTILPPLPEQQAIVSYLDRVTGDIDRAIAESQRMIDLLNERKQIIIQHAVTKGLNPNAKRKYSGTEWIGDVPEGWEVRKLRYLCKIKTGDKDTIMREEEGKYPFFVRSPKIERINTYTFDTEAILMAGDGAGAGRIFHYYKGKFGCHQRVYCLHDFSIDVYPQFLYYQLSHFFKEVFLGVSAKSTVDSVRLPMLKDFQIVFPKISEQQQIVDHIEKSLEPISQAIASTERKISLLRERKQIIINEVVTGKVKVS